MEWNAGIFKTQSRGMAMTERGGFFQDEKQWSDQNGWGARPSLFLINPSQSGTCGETEPQLPRIDQGGSWGELAA